MRPGVGIAISLLIHAAVVAALLLAPKGQTTPQVKRGEPLIVELPNIPEPAPKGNPSARSPAPPAPTAARPAPPPVPAVRPAPPAPPRVAAAPPTPAPAPPAPAPVTPPSPPVATPAPPAPAPAAEPAPAPLPAHEAAPSPAPPERAVATPPAPASPAPTPSERGGDTRVAAVPSTPREPPRPDIRSALRRGGEAAGGLSGGRGGIEGEPIPLDSDDPRFSEYLDRIRRLIRSKWGYPCAEGDPHAIHCLRRDGELVIEFGIAKDGHVPFVLLRNSSGSVNMDDFALNAVRLASPFPPLPDSVSKKGIPILATFRYMIREELMNILR
ncbi:MAG TPA: TonB family protein [Methylomirabilota bacterium]